MTIRYATKEAAEKAHRKVMELHAGLFRRLAQKEMDRRDIEDARRALKEAKRKGTKPLRDLMSKP